MPTVITGTQTAVAGLTPGTQYRFRVRARNIAGHGPFSAWSDPVSPTTGTPQPPPTAVSLGVTIAPHFSAPSDSSACLDTTRVARNYIARLDVGVTPSDPNAMLYGVTYQWEGRRWRVKSGGSWSSGNPWKFVTSSASTSWTPIDSGNSSDFATITFPPLYPTAGQEGAVLLGPTPTFYVLRDGGKTLYGRARVVDCGASTVTDFPSHFWELRCVVTAQYVSSGTGGSATGTSRTVSFKEIWNGIDYATQVQ